MKKNVLFLSAVAAVAMFASCSNDSLVSDTAPASDPQIKFNTSMKNITRAVTTDANFASFKVSAFEDGSTTAHFSDEEVTKNVSTWSATNDLYWAKSGKKLNFFAYSPTTLTPTTTSTGISLSNFELSTTLADQKDILVAYKQQQYNATTGADNTVNLNFKHALSNIVIKARNETVGGYEVKVKGVRVGNVKPSGDFSFDGTDYTWSNYGGALANYQIGGKDVESYTVVTVVTGTSTSSDLMNNEELLIIPQSYSTNSVWDKTESNQGARISICCQIHNGSTRIFPAADKTVEYGWISVPLPASYDWNAGSKYIYTVRFFPDGSGDTGNVDDPDLPDVPSDPIPDVAIEFTAQIDGWTNGNGESGETIPSETD